MSGTRDGATCMVSGEAGFGSTDMTDARALDDATLAGLTGMSIGITKDAFNGVAGSLRQVSYDRADVTLSGGMAQARVEAAVNGSGSVKRLVGTVTLEGELRGFGALTPAATGWGLLMDAGFDATLRTPGTHCTATGVTDNTFSVAGGDIGKFAIGDIIAVTQDDGTFRACKVSTRNTGTNVVTTVEPHGVTALATATVRQCHMWYPLQGNPAGASIVAQFAHADGDFTLLGVGGCTKSMEIFRTGQASLAWRAEVEFADGEYRDAVVIPVSKPYPMGAASAATTPLVTLVAPMRVTQDHASTAAPWYGTSLPLAARTWSAKMVNDLQPIADQAMRSGRSGTAITATSGEGSFTQTAPTGSAPDWREVLRKGEKRAVGFTAAGANAAGNGFGVWVGAVEVATDPGVAFADTDRTQDVAWRSGDYAGDVTASAGPAANKPIIFWAVC